MQIIIVFVFVNGQSNFPQSVNDGSYMHSWVLNRPKQCRHRRVTDIRQRTRCV